MNVETIVDFRLLIITSIRDAIQAYIENELEYDEHQQHVFNELYLEHYVELTMNQWIEDLYRNRFVDDDTILDEKIEIIFHSFRDYILQSRLGLIPIIYKDWSNYYEDIMGPIIRVDYYKYFNFYQAWPHVIDVFNQRELLK
jgi:hypothetical protein